jgi:hypothetical protein
MLKQIVTILILFSFLSCKKEEPIIVKKENVYKIEIDGRLPFDVNGYYHLKLDSTKNQTIHRISGSLRLNGEIPFPSEKIEWNSNLYWYIVQGDTIARITKTYINYFTGNVTVVSLPPLVSNKTELVPTINSASYSGYGVGDINTVIAPIYKMKGDTMIIKASIEKEFKITKIVLE